MRYGLSNVISLLHRGPGISRAVDQKMYEACASQSEKVKEHLTIEGMMLVHEPVLGLFSAVCRDRDEIADECAAQGQEPFLPVWNAQALDYHTSVVAVILRQRRVGFEGGDEGWIEIEELIGQFETFLPDDDKGDETRIKDKVLSAVKLLSTLDFVEIGQTNEGKDTARATGWLIVRLTQQEMERFSDLMTDDFKDLSDDVAQAIMENDDE